jgi:hypothetical protein
MIRLSSIIVTLLLFLSTHAQACFYEQYHRPSHRAGSHSDWPDLSYVGDHEMGAWRSHARNVSEVNLIFDRDSRSWHWIRSENGHHPEPVSRSNHKKEDFGARQWDHMGGRDTHINHHPDGHDRLTDCPSNLPAVFDDMLNYFRGTNGLNLPEELDPLWMIAFDGGGHQDGGHPVALFPYPDPPAETQIPAATPIPASAFLLASAGGCTGLFMKRRRVNKLT